MRKRVLARVLLVLAVVILAGCSTTATTSTLTPTPTPVVVDREVTTGTVSLEGLPVSAEFKVESPDPGIRFPVSVTFGRADLGNYTEVAVYRVAEGEPFNVELLGGARYRITVEDADGDICRPGLYEVLEKNPEHTLLINAGDVVSC